MEKVQKKKKKNFLKDVFPCGFPISGDKKGEKVSGIVFFRKGRVKKKKKKKFFKGCFPLRFS